MFVSAKHNEKSASKSKDRKDNSIVGLPCFPDVPIHATGFGPPGFEGDLYDRQFRTTLDSTGNRAHSAAGDLRRWGVGAVVLTMRPTLVT
jgi:hypothetical protein